MVKMIIKFTIALAVFTLVVYLGAQFYRAGEETAVTETKAGIPENIAPIKPLATTVTMKLDYGDKNIKSFGNTRIKANETVFSLMEKILRENNIKFKYQDYGGSLGVFVEAIGDKANDAKTGKYWQFWVNGVLAPVGPGAQKLKSGDIVEWKYAKAQM